MVGAILIVLAISCNKPTKDNDQLVLFELPDTVFRQWDDIHDEDYLSLDEDRRFKVEYPDGKILIFGENEDGESVSIYGGNPNGVETLIIPSTVKHSGKSYRVTNIAKFAFATLDYDSIQWMKGVKNIVIEEGIETCGMGCFEREPDLKQVYLPASLTSLDYCLFSNCKELEKVNIAADSQMLGIMEFAFENCEKLKEFEIPASVSLIREGPWRNCKALPYIKVAEGNKNYRSINGVLYTISGRKLIQYPAGKRNKEYVVESGTIEIKNSAFYGNEYLEKVEFTSSLEDIAHLAFYGCTRLKDADFNIGLKWIGNSAFQECCSLKNVRLKGNTAYTTGKDWGYNSFPDWTKVKD